jgi:ribonucleotide reductase beta subunit family protein with ferritin-like domain
MSTELLNRHTEEDLAHYYQQTGDPVVKNLYLLALEKFEPLLTENKDRFVLFPIQYEDIWSYYLRALGSFWTPKEITLSDDVLQWKDPSRLDEDTKFFVKRILAFFAAADGIVNENLASRFFSEVQVPEVRSFYGFQIAIENIHNEVYSLLIDTYIELKQEKEHLLKAIETIPCIKKMADWSLKWLNSDRPFSERLIAFACVEAIMFSGPFCAIYWLKKRNLLPGLCMSNELISRDEALHAEFACLLHHHLKYKASETTILDVVIEAVNLEINFINDSIPCRLIGMNSDSMTQYIKFIADRLLTQLGCQTFYNVKNPFDWMDMISMDNKTNFFEKRVSEYSRARFTSSNVNSVKTEDKIQLLDNF